MDGRKQRLPADDDVIHHSAHALQGVLSYAHRFSFFIWKYQNDSNTLPVRARLLIHKRNPPFKNIQIRVDKCG